jgi:hypothetical protein
MNKENIIQKESAEYANYDFLNDLYQKVYDWGIEDQKGEVVNNFDKQIINWDIADSYDTYRVKVDLEKGLVIEDEKKYLVLILGYGNRNRGDYFRCQRLMFDIIEKKDNVDINLDTVINSFDCKGEFYTDGLNNSVKVESHYSCFLMRSGQFRDEILKDERYLNEALNVVKRTADLMLGDKSLLIE